MDRPRVLLSVAMSVDGHIDDATAARLVLSDPADLDRVDGERAAVDAILVGATTVRRDDPRLRVRSADRVAARVAAGRPAQPLRVVLSSRGELDPAARVFGDGSGGGSGPAGGARPVVYLPSGVAPPGPLAAVATVVGAGDPLDPGRVLADLAARGVERLMIEGGTSVHTLFLAAGLVDEIQLALAPLFVGDPSAPRFVGAFPAAAATPGGGPRMRLVEARPVGDMVLVRYLLAAPDAQPR